jgi:hypothetical protein
MSDLAGKTIEKVDSDSPDPNTGQRRGEYALLYFTDGTALELSAGGGYDGEGYPTWDLLDAQAVADRVAAGVRCEEEQAEEKRKREAWMALTCAQRAARLNRNVNPPAGSMIPEFYADRIIDGLQRGPKDRTVKDRCSRCRERECPNAPTRVLEGTGSLLT